MRAVARGAPLWFLLTLRRLVPWSRNVHPRERLLLPLLDASVGCGVLETVFGVPARGRHVSSALRRANFKEGLVIEAERQPAL
jgi:hypothetical protein